MTTSPSVQIAWSRSLRNGFPARHPRRRLGTRSQHLRGRARRPRLRLRRLSHWIHRRSRSSGIDGPRPEPLALVGSWYSPVVGARVPERSVGAVRPSRAPDSSSPDLNQAIAPERFAPAMARQLERFGEALAEGMPRRGWKVGINVPEMLRQLDLPHPGVGWLDGRRVYPAGAELHPDSDARLHVEPEVAIVLSRAVSSRFSAEAARDCIAAVHPALEIVDYGKPSSGLEDVIAHCMFHDATILGPRASLEAARDLGHGLPILRVGTRSCEPPRSDLVPSDLGELVAFVAGFLAAFGQSLEPGDTVLSGSYVARAPAIAAGEEAVAGFGPLGTVSATVTA